MSRLKPQSFPALKAHWYRKLQESGFEDAEDAQGNLKEREPFTLSRGAQGDKTFCDSKETYFRLAGVFLYAHTFETKLERKIWQLHAEGLPVRRIAEICNRSNRKVTRMRVQNTIEKLRVKMRGI